MLAAKLVEVVLMTCALLMGGVENKSSFGIGGRLMGDQLLVKDVLEARSAGIEQTPTITFNYAVEEQITNIEITSEENVFANVDFSYEDNIVSGTVKASNESGSPSFEVVVHIYGFNATLAQVNSPHIINRNQHFAGWLEPDDPLDTSQERNGDDGDDDDNGDDDDDNDDDDDYVVADIAEPPAEIDADFEHTDKTIELGQRQSGDYLIYRTYQTSATRTDRPTNHSVVFYYIDNDYITCARFIVVGSFEDEAAAAQRTPPSAEYTLFSSKTLKAVVTEHNTTMMLAEMQLYGYKANDVPDTYVPFTDTFRHSGLDGVGLGGGGPGTTMSPLQRLRMKMQNSGTSDGDAEHLTDPDDDDDDEDDDDDGDGDNNDADDGNDNGDDDDDDEENSVATSKEDESKKPDSPVCTAGAVGISSERVSDSFWAAGLIFLIAYLWR